MGKYLVTWEIDQSKIPVNPQERANAWLALLSMTKQDMQTGLVKDWGTLVGELSGYTINEGSEVDVGKLTQKYVPFLTFKVHQILSLAQVEEVLKSLSK